MPLMHRTNLQELVNQTILGDVLRAGGTVNQLIHYRDSVRVTDANLLDGGFGSIKGFKKASSLIEFLKTAKRLVKQEVNHFRHGAKVPLDRKTIELDMHFAWNETSLHHRFDASISSNMIEHSPNVLLLLLNFHIVTKHDGWLFHAIPNYRYTYDRFRAPTRMDHFLEDFEARMLFDDFTHVDDYTQSAITKDGWQREFHKKFPVRYPFIHFHVFDESNTAELFNYVFEDVNVDVIRNESFSDNLVLCRNRLKPSFKEKYGHLISEVQTGQYTSKFNEFYMNDPHHRVLL